MGQIRKGKKQGYGIFKSLLTGVAGSFIGWFLMGFMNIEFPNLLTQVLMAMTGVALLFFVTGLIFGKKKKKPEEGDE